MNYPKWIKPFYIFAALYDGLLGILFFIVPFKVFKLAHVTFPNHIGYVQFPALLLVIFSLIFYAIAKDPVANKKLIHYGIMLKFSYCAVVFPHWLAGTIPTLWAIFAFFDLAFLIAFIITYRAIK